MSQRLDIDQVLRTWLDENELTPPDAPVWDALERIETTRQRGALWVSLEERIMRMQPIATVAAAVVISVIGLAIYFNMAGEASIGEPGPTATAAPGTTRTEDFSHSMILTVPDDWVLVEEASSMAITRLAEGAIMERIIVFESTGAEIWGGDGHEPFPDDIEAWIDNFPAPTAETGIGSIQLTLVGTAVTSVDGSEATLVDVNTSFTPDPSGETSFNFILNEAANVGTDLLLLEGEGRIQFVVVEDRGLVIAYYAPADQYDPDTFEQFVASLQFVSDSDR